MRTLGSATRWPGMVAAWVEARSRSSGSVWAFAFTGVLAACSGKGGSATGTNNMLSDASGGGRPGLDASTVEGAVEAGAPLEAPFVAGTPRSCTKLVPWPFQSTALVVKNADGFASPVSTDLGAMLTVFRVDGTPLRDIGKLRPTSACIGGPYGAWSGGGQTVALSSYSYKFFCGFDLTMNGATMSLAGDPYGRTRVAVAVRDDMKTVLAKSDVSQPSTADAPRTITLSLLDRAGTELSVTTLPSELMDVRSVAVSHAGYVAVVLGAPVTSPYGIPASVRVELFDSGFHSLASWTAPAGVTLNSVAFAGDGSVVTAGWVSAADSGTYAMWLQHLSSPALAPLSLAVVGAAGGIEDISVAQDKIVLAALSTDQTTIRIDTWTLDGNPTDGPRLSQSMGNAYWVRLQVQSDGSLLVQSQAGLYPAGYVCQ